MLVAPAFAGNGGVLPLSPHSPAARHIAHLYLLVLVVAVVAFAVIEGALLVIVARYRRGARRRFADGAQIRGSVRLQLVWTVVPAVVLAAVGGVVLDTASSISNPPAASAASSTTITVEGHQFYWLFRYPNGAISVGTMVAPAGEVVRENVVSAPGDVTHTWWVPELGGAIDAIPGRTDHSWFKAPAGLYASPCTELCGAGGGMLAAVDVVTPQAYARFIATRAAAPAGVALGMEEYQHSCATCHTLSEPSVGPALGANPLLTEVGSLETLLRRGIGTMPAVGSNWSHAQVQALVAYTTRLVRGAGGASDRTG
jgi:cytochrome c oxidase subunit 2